jgi:hypothetical protein
MDKSNRQFQVVSASVSGGVKHLWSSDSLRNAIEKATEFILKRDKDEEWETFINVRVYEDDGKTIVINLNEYVVTDLYYIKEYLK